MVFNSDLGKLDEYPRRSQQSNFTNNAAFVFDDDTESAIDRKQKQQEYEPLEEVVVDFGSETTKLPA